ncbi:tetratricopeptide repeat protein [Sulfurospirillum oryzae]|uniref:tetratricopeptide repeat protein n=1 Tax=Sulfurospirillum oryzae TaxID=2976535 RepID=UPI0021E6FE4B|nr:tetratricopeptide repeat protein [Sulfurospirillum oryzae]
MMEPHTQAFVMAGDTFLKDRELSSAITCYHKALTYPLEKQIAVKVLNNLGVAYKRQGSFENAIAIFQKGIETDASYPAFYSNLSVVYRLQKRYQEALDILIKTVSLHQQFHDYRTLVEFLGFLKKPQEALSMAYEAQKRFPKEYEAHLVLGNLFASFKAYHQAIEPYLNAISLAPEKTQAYNNLGVAYKELGQNKESLEAYQKVLALNPKDSAVYNNLGNLLRNMGDLKGALEHLKYSIALNPDYADAYSNVGAVYKEAKEYQAAIPYYQKALALKPEHTNANFDMALIELTFGNYESGWKRYEHRLKMSELIAKIHPYKTPMWRGESLLGKTLLLQNEQGYGDNIMFIRYVSFFVAMGAKVIVRTRPELVSLFAFVEGIDAVYSEEEAIPLHDYYLPLLSAPFYFKTTLETIPKAFPYLHVKHQTVTLSLDKQRLNIGLVWSSSRTNKDFNNKYIGLFQYKSLFEIPNTAWYSLQVGEDALEIEKEGLEDKIVDLSPHLIDFAATAQMIQKLDLVITMDTAVAHLCGALHKEAWVLVPKPADWRWMQEGDRTPWYESLILFRQVNKGDWSVPIEAVKTRLKSFSRNDKIGIIGA